MSIIVSLLLRVELNCDEELSVDETSEEISTKKQGRQVIVYVSKEKRREEKDIVF